MTEVEHYKPVTSCINLPSAQSWYKNMELQMVKFHPAFDISTLSQHVSNVNVMSHKYLELHLPSSSFHYLQEVLFSDGVLKNTKWILFLSPLLIFTADKQIQ